MRRVLLVLLVLLVPGCAVSAERAAPRCSSPERTALVAQSVPAASYVPCLRDLPAGWRETAFTPRSGRTRLALLSDRSGGRPVVVELVPSCDVSGASPADPRAPGVRSYLRLRSVTPSYAGTASDVFAGGCVTYSFDFPRGPHIPLMEQLLASVALVPRDELRRQVRHAVGTELDP